MSNSPFTRKCVNRLVAERGAIGAKSHFEIDRCGGGVKRGFKRQLEPVEAILHRWQGLGATQKEDPMMPQSGEQLTYLFTAIKVVNEDAGDASKPFVNNYNGSPLFQGVLKRAVGYARAREIEEPIHLAAQQHIQIVRFSGWIKIGIAQNNAITTFLRMRFQGFGHSAEERVIEVRYEQAE